MFKTNGIFSTPITIKENVFQFNNNQIKDYLSFEIGYKNGEKGSFLSKDYYILNSVNLIEIKKILNKEIMIYEKEVLGFKSNSLYITNSWFSKIEKGGYHPIHNHPNSFISGVCYLNVPSKSEKIYFHHRSALFNKFDFYLKEKVSNQFNEDNFQFEVKTGDLLFFPSWINHSVGVNMENNQRLVLAFNCFIKGFFGDNVYPNNLEIK